MALLKQWLARHMLIIEFCGDCGRRVGQVWHTSDTLWTLLVPDDATRPGTMCVRCFDRRAQASGLMIYWRADVDDSHFLDVNLSRLPDAITQRIPDNPCCIQTAKQTAALLQAAYLRTEVKR